MRRKFPGVTLFELIVTLTVITAATAVIFLTISNSVSTDKFKAQALMQHVREIQLAVEVFSEQTGCTPRAIDDLTEKEFFDFEPKLPEGITLRDPCRAALEFKSPWNGPYYPKEDKFIRCYAETVNLMEGTILKPPEAESPPYHCDTIGTPNTENSVRTGAVDLSFIHKGMVGVLLNGRLKWKDHSQTTHRLPLMMPGVDTVNLRTRYVNPNRYFNIYKIAKIPPGVISEFLSLCFSHPAGKEFKLVTKEDEVSQPDGTIAKSTSLALEDYSGGDFIHPDNKTNSPGLGTQDHGDETSWFSRCAVSTEIFAKEGEYTAPNPGDELYLYIIF